MTRNLALFLLKSSVVNTGSLKKTLAPTLWLTLLLSFAAGHAVAAPASGVKNLYFQAPDSENSPTIPQDMSRLPLTAEPPIGRVRVLSNGAALLWAQIPALQLPLNLSAGNVPVVLQLRRSGNPSSRTIRVSLDYDLAGAVTTLGSVDVVLPGTGAAGISNSVTRAFTFPVPIAASTIPAGAQLRVSVDNDPADTPGRSIYVYPYDAVTGDTSRVELPATTVINVDSTTVYDAAFPGGAVISSAAPGSTVYVRTVVSDPFGSFDITSSTIDIVDPTATPVVTAAAMTEVNDSGAAIKTYEYVYTFAGAATSGSWTFQITASEGTEGTVGHTAITSFDVTTGSNPDLLVSKTADMANAAPGDVVTYTVTITNTGVGQATSVVAEASLSPFISLALAPFGNGTIYFFTDGVNPSGLPGTGTVTYSDNNGLDGFVYAPVDNGFGYDPNVTDFRINLDGAMNADVLNNPSFNVHYQAEVNQ